MEISGPPRDERSSAHRSYRGAWRARRVERRVREVARGAFGGVREREVECARGTGGMGARRPTRGAFSAGRFGATTGSRAGALPSHFPIRRGWETRSGPTATSADRRDESHSRPTIRGNRRVVNRENAVGDRPGRRLAAPSARPSPLFFWKRAFHAAVPAVLTPRDTLARKQETPNDFGPPQGPTHDVGLRQRRRGRLRVHPGERRV